MSRYDTVGVTVGFASLLYGIAHWSHAAAWVVGGLAVIVAALWPPNGKAAR